MCVPLRDPVAHPTNGKRMAEFVHWMIEAPIPAIRLMIRSSGLVTQAQRRCFGYGG